MNELKENLINVCDLYEKGIHSQTIAGRIRDLWNALQPVKTKVELALVLSNFQRSYEDEVVHGAPPKKCYKPSFYSPVPKEQGSLLWRTVITTLKMFLPQELQAFIYPLSDIENENVGSALRP